LRKFSIALIAGTLLLAGCSMAGGLKSNEAIKGAIEAHLKDNPALSMQNFNTEIESVQYKDDTADALAKFVSKADPNSAVEVRYQLKLDAARGKSFQASPRAAKAWAVTVAQPLVPYRRGILPSRKGRARGRANPLRKQATE